MGIVVDGNKVTLASLKELRSRAARLAFQVLTAKRSTDGYENWIADLKNTTSRDKAGEYSDGRGCWKYNSATDRVESKDFSEDLTSKKIKSGWSLELKNGRLNVAARHITVDLMRFLDSKLNGKSWYEDESKKPTQINPPKLPEGFSAFSQEYKTLGYWEENPAMDVAGILIDKTGKLSVQVIKRQDGTFAFVGGMVYKHLPVDEQKNEVREKCYHETLEELFSGGMFTPDSKSSSAVGELSSATWNQALRDVFALDEFKKKREFSQMLPMASELQNIFEAAGDFNSRMARLQANLMRMGLERKIPQADLEIFWTQVKCRLYEKLLPEQYKLLTDFLDKNMRDMPKTVNAADYRNTQFSYMTTTPHYFLVNKAELLNLKKGMLLEATGGDDALEALIVPLEDLYKTGMFASHEEILLGMLEDIEQKSPGFLSNPAIVGQLKQVEEYISTRERENNQLQVVAETSSAPSLLLQTVEKPVSSNNNNSNSNSNNNIVDTTSKPEQVIPMPTTMAEFIQISDQMYSLAQDDELDPIALTESVRSANEKLLAKLGGPLYAELGEILEKARLPLSGRIVLAELSDCQEIDFLFDDSTSMDEAFNKGTQDDPFVYVRGRHGNSVKKTRWYEAFDRFELLLPLAALAGVKVNIRLLNGRQLPNKLSEHSVLKGFAPSTNGAYCFDFSKKSTNGVNDVQTFQTELYRATQFLAVVKAAGPSGSTNATPHLAEILKAYKEDERHPIVFITDGETDDPGKDAELLRNRSNPVRNPIMVVACTRQSEKIQWVRELMQQNYCIMMLDDFATERQLIRNNHGTKVSYTDKIWLLSNLLMVKPKGQATQGLHLLYSALKENKELTEKELSEYLGYKNLPDGYYRKYTEDRKLFQARLANQNSSTSNLSTRSLYVSAFPVPSAPPPDEPPPSYNNNNNNNASQDGIFSRLFGFKN